MNILELNWIVTEDISDVNKEEFDYEWNELYGYFEMCLNQRLIGYWPKRELFQDEEGTEAILYWIIHLLRSLISLSNRDEYEFHLLSMNTRKLVIKKNSYIEIYFVGLERDEIEWKENIKPSEYYRVILDNAERLLSFIKDKNEYLLLAKVVNDLSNLYLLCKKLKCSANI